jgi:SAM-dependent methyltransferase
VTETERILAEYARRQRELPPDLYSISRPGNLFLRQTLEREVLALLSKLGLLPLRDRRMLDVGCGSGQELADLETWGARRSNLAGIDLIGTRARAAQARLQGLDIRHGDATQLPWDDGSFDIVMQSMVFSSILDPAMRTTVAREMIRVLEPRGVIIWYDFFVQNPRNPHVRGVRKEEIALLFPGFSQTRRRVTLLPPFARRLAQTSWLLAEFASRLKLMNTHLLVALRRTETTGPPS